MKLLTIIVVVFFIAGCSSLKKAPPVSGELQPLNTVAVMNEQSAEK